MDNDEMRQRQLQFSVANRLQLVAEVLRETTIEYLGADLELWVNTQHAKMRAMSVELFEISEQVRRRTKRSHR